ncbi:unnamed protein product [Rotaria socialis]|uniref:F-box domain-containing protein n=1 Tax=Rotaria socialis TaxID=392032 RepID=A0A820YX72_9BILA|nr:unnamed protein product [Rotaria socialis]CAF4556507.1 unnamed protein product [Rotaria socialis]
MVEEKDTFQLQFETPPVKSMLLEQLPNELLIYVFEFLSHCDLYHAMYNLNSRLNKLCHTLKLYLDLDGIKSAFDDFCSSPRPLRSQIYSLRLSDRLDRLTLVHQFTDIGIFTNLRALTITDASSENLDKVVSKLHLLRHLFYLNISRAAIQSVYITTALFSLQSLKYLILYSVEPIIFNFNHADIHPLTALEYLEIDGCHVVEFLELLKYVGPNLNRMKIGIHYTNDQDLESIDGQIIDNHRCASLSHLHMSFNYLSLTNFQLVVKLFPNLRHLTLSTFNDDLNFVSAAIWHRFISTYLLKLEKFQFHIRIDDVVQSPPPELVYSFNDLNGQWIDSSVIMDYNFRLDPSLFEFYTYSQPSLDGKYIVEFYDKKRYITAMNDMINIDKNITKLKITLHDDQLVANEPPITYPNVTSINVHSQITTIAAENDTTKNSLICSDIQKSIPDLSKINTLAFTTHSPTDSIHSPLTFTHDLLVMLSNVDHLYIPYNYLLQLLKSPSIVQELAKKIDCLSISFYNDPPLFEDMMRIISLFSARLLFLNFDIYIDFPYVTFYLILPLIMRGICAELVTFDLMLCGQNEQQALTFNKEFKTWFKQCLTTLAKANEKQSARIEYRITDRNFIISF